MELDLPGEAVRVQDVVPGKESEGPGGWVAAVLAQGQGAIAFAPTAELDCPIREVLRVTTLVAQNAERKW
jgi:hypothetical protein